MTDFTDTSMSAPLTKSQLKEQNEILAEQVERLKRIDSAKLTKEVPVIEAAMLGLTAALAGEHGKMVTVEETWIPASDGEEAQLVVMRDGKCIPLRLLGRTLK